MKKKLTFLMAFIFMFLMVTFWSTAEEVGNNPVAVSPGSETDVVTVWQSCPTFSWSSVDQAASYRIAVFESVDGKIAPHEGMAIMSSPVISKQISGPALSWTLSSEESLKTGSMYVWYVQAMDSYGNGMGNWSNGRIFKVEQEVRFAGIEEKLGEILKSYGVSEETTTNVLKDMKSVVKEVVVRDGGIKNTPGASGVQGYEGDINTFYGLNAGASNTTGQYNTFIGSGAGYSNTEGGANTFIGYKAGNSNTTGTPNTFLGYNAGYSNTTGSYNSFFGKAAGYSNTTGRENTFIGQYTGNFNTTGSYNTFVGSATGIFNTTGRYNTFLGNFAGDYNTTGSYNTFLGFGTGVFNTTGNSNTFIGWYSGAKNTTGYENTSLGYQAGYSSTTGAHNTLVGNYSGYTNSTGVGNILLGYKAGYNETGSNKLYIANSEIGSPLIYGEFDNGIVTINGKLGLGTNTPSGALEIKKTGSNATFILSRTDGAQGKFTARSGEIYIGSVTNHKVQIISNNCVVMTLSPNGYVGIGKTALSYPLHMASGAYCSKGGTWTNASSRALKENIENLSAGEAVAALTKLNPVKYNYKVDKTDKHVGFIAEDVPELVATSDRKGLSPMDVTAVLTKVVQEQQNVIHEYRKLISDLQERVATLEKK